jgi:hypothetical protein
MNSFQKELNFIHLLVSKSWKLFSLLLCLKSDFT